MATTVTTSATTRASGTESVNWSPAWLRLINVWNRWKLRILFGSTETSYKLAEAKINEIAFGLVADVALAIAALVMMFVVRVVNW
jgi:hypothetical protein